MQGIVSGSYQQGANALDAILNFQPLLDSLGKILDDYRPATYLIAFILLVVSTMHGFMQTESRRFFHNLVHSIILVALVCQAGTIFDWFDEAAKAFAALPQARTINIGGKNITFKSGESPLINEIQAGLASKVQQKVSSGKKDEGINLLDPRSWLNSARAVVFQILFGVYLLILLLAKMIILLMVLIQKIIVIGFKLYLPIGIAEYSIRALKGKATSFLLTFIGVLCWPIGWSIVNSVTLAILSLVPAPEDYDLPSLIWGNVMVLPVLIWVLVGHVLAPIYLQKVVVHGGGAIQGFVGATLSTVGMASASLSAAGLTSIETGPHPVLAEGRQTARASGRRTGGKREIQDRGNAAALPIGLATEVVGRAGVIAGLLGHAVVQGSGGGIGLEGETLAALAPIGAYARGTRRRVASLNNSSVRAREYVDFDDNLRQDG
jgi:hypothetical protein